MITYKIAGLDSVLKSKPENFEGDVLRWKQRSSLPYHAEVTILENDEHNNQPATDSTSDGDADQLEPVSKKSRNSKRVYLVESTKEAIDLQPVHDDLDIVDVPVVDEPTADLDDSATESN